MSPPAQQGCCNEPCRMIAVSGCLGVLGFPNISTPELRQFLHSIRESRLYWVSEVPETPGRRSIPIHAPGYFAFKFCAACIGK